MTNNRTNNKDSKKLQQPLNESNWKMPPPPKPKKQKNTTKAKKSAGIEPRKVGQKPRKEEFTKYREAQPKSQEIPPEEFTL